MTGILLRLAIYLVIAAAIYLGVRKIWRDWQGQFRKEDEQARSLRQERDRAERAKPGVIDLKRDEDGTFRPGGRNDENNRR
jgi:flagellar biosynthesis/type III secretory pathway M-ring protein FliF/YscJ